MILNLVLGVVLGLIISVVSYKFKLLNLSGAIATFFLAWIIFSFGQVKWTIPILTFFILSSLLSKFRKKINPKVDSYFPKSNERDQVQVLANGGFPGILVLINQLHGSELFYIAYVSAIAAVCSDTWATEIGTMFNTKTFNIINFHQVEQGISGGVSLIGFMGAALGAMSISVSVTPWLNNISEIILIIFLSGFLGSTFDSVLGSTLQGKFNCTVCNKKIESKSHCGKNSVHTKGYRWLNNDAVNFAASLFSILMIFLFSQILPQSAAEKFNLGMKAFDNKDYVEANNYFESFFREYNEIDEMYSTAKYYSGESLLNLGEGHAAKERFEFLVNNYKWSTFRDAALYKLGLIYYDIKKFDQSRDRLNSLINDYP